MTDNTNLFDETNKPADPPKTPSDDPFADKLKSIVNEDGKPKYKDVNAALEALAHSQQFIETLKTEKSDTQKKLEELARELEKRESVEDVVARLTQTQNHQVKEDQPKTTGLDEKKVLDLINQALTSTKTVEKQEANLQMVTSELSKVYGDNAKDAISERAKELNTTTSNLKEIAKDNPVMFLSLMSGKAPASTPKSMTSSINPLKTQKDKTELPKATKSIMRGGASTEEMLEHWRAVQAATYARLGVET